MTRTFLYFATASRCIVGIIALTLAWVPAARAGNAPPPSVTPPVASQTAVEGANSSIDLGSFSDGSSSTSWSVVANWGDGSPPLPFTTTTQGSLGSQLHLYGEEGSYTVTVTVINAFGASGSTFFTAATSDPAVLGTGVAVTGVAGTQFTGDVATFTDPGGKEPNASGVHYTATIDWGDGTLSSATILDPVAMLEVYGTHTYATDGLFTITTVIDHEGVDTTVTSTATIAEPATLALLGLGLAGLGFSRRRKVN